MRRARARACRASRGTTVGLAKGTSNLFRDRDTTRRRLLDVRDFDHVLSVAIRHRRFDDAGSFFAALDGACRGDADFVDGVVFGRDRLVLTEGRFVTRAPAVSDYTFERIYYRSLLERTEDHLTVLRTSARNARCCAGCTVVACSIRGPTRRSCAGTPGMA